MENKKKIAQNRKWDILGIGSPLFDIGISIGEEIFGQLGFKKGSMNLISKKQSQEILKKLEHMAWEMTPGGSAANTLTGASLLGNRVAFLGTVGRDKHGKMYQEKIEESGVVAHMSYHGKDATGHSIILATPDGERTMLTHLGAAVKFTKEHIKEKEIRNSKILHVEAYQLEQSDTRHAILEAIRIAKSHQVLVSLDLSDAGLVKRNKDFFQFFVKEHIDIIFANEEEALEFSDKMDPVEALHAIAVDCHVTVVKMGAQGSLIKRGKNMSKIDVHPVEMINTNGAGDMYAAGILHGLVRELDLQEAGKIASHVSALVVSSVGARMDKKHHHLIAKYK